MVVSTVHHRRPLPPSLVTPSLSEVEGHGLPVYRFVGTDPDQDPFVVAIQYLPPCLVSGDASYFVDGLHEKAHFTTIVFGGELEGRVALHCLHHHVEEGLGVSAAQGDALLKGGRPQNVAHDQRHLLKAKEMARSAAPDVLD